jgi:hypothetical protein
VQASLPSWTATGARARRPRRQTHRGEGRPARPQRQVPFRAHNFRNMRTSVAASPLSLEISWLVWGADTWYSIDRNMRVVGPDVGTCVWVGKTTSGKKTLAIWRKRSPNCDYMGLPPYPLSQLDDVWVRQEG